MDHYLYGDAKNAWCSGFGKLGFGLMRLPRKDENTIDVEETKKMVDHFMAAGMHYFDTAWAYDGSEDAIRQALVERYPRDRFFLVDKLNARMAKDEAEAKDEINVSLKRAGVSYFDLYFLHAIQDGNIDFYNRYGLWDYAKQLKEEGRIRHIGFSFHGSPELLENLLDAHPEVELVQLQINYADWENPKVQSRANLAVCQKHHIPVTIMEPVKGGLLANPPKEIQDLLRQAEPDMSFASWAIRFAASQEGVVTVLSGMSSLEQMDNNLSYMKDFQPLNAQENDVILKARDILSKANQIACTGCHYCMPGCPVHMHIPDIFTAMNVYKMYGRLDKAKQEYRFAVNGSSLASQCLHCGQCEGACPQSLPIISYLEEAARTLE
ncbi:MAG: aldo/keto reductase [Lachnospiraceae bacterium]|uniref:aldo/keto reductase n=2 Tax=Galactobacillus timonensis TaxID=2041840 RepID=UPI0023F1E0BC|nr:aldo/keto reductase [Galactobacillus timonensis]MDD7086644.1 aldo/keto reductase [Galactobacillus timonensis]MDY5221977.1 aldo/keto reductase [Lachnospiraceae bacterium]